jgi:CRP-like cAMP-binding protein
MLKPNEEEGASRFPNTGEFLAGRIRDELSSEDLLHLEQLVCEVSDHADGAVLVEAGEPVDRSLILIEGFVLRTMTGQGRRFVVSVHVPGDFIDLHGFALKRLDHDVVAAGPVRIGSVPHDRLQEVLENRPGLSRALWFATLLDAAIHRKWIQMLEQLDAPRRIAHLYAELHTRLELIGRRATRALRTPFTQSDLADMCGVSAIHANRAVGKLRDLGIGEIRRGDLYTSDWAALKEFARFDPGYLYAGGGGDDRPMAERKPAVASAIAR